MMFAHLQAIFAKSAAVKQTPPEIDIAHLGWEIKYGIPVSTTHDQTIARELC